MIESAIRLMNYLIDRLRYLQPTVAGLVASASEAPGLEGAPYVRECRRRMEQGAGFPESWRRSVSSHEGTLGKEGTAILESLSEILGASDLESQLTALDYARERLRRCLEQARTRKEQRQKLYCALGVLVGAGAAVILI